MEVRKTYKGITIETSSLKKTKIDESIKRVITFRNISKKLESNKGIEKFFD